MTTTALHPSSAPLPSTFAAATIAEAEVTFVTDLLHLGGSYRAPLLPVMVRGLGRRLRAALPPTEGVLGALGTGQLSALALACTGPGALARRDHALVRVLAQSALHHDTVRTMCPGDVDLGRGRLVLIPRGEQRTRFVPLGDHTVRALTQHLADLGAGAHVLWPGPWGGAMTVGELRSILDHRAGMGGLGPVLPTSLRRSALHRWSAGGGSQAGFVALHGQHPDDALPARVVPTTRARALAEARQVDLDDF